MQECLELGGGFEVVSDGDGAGDPGREPVGGAAIAVGEGEAFRFDQCAYFLGEPLGSGAGEQ